MSASSSSRRRRRYRAARREQQAVASSPSSSSEGAATTTTTTTTTARKPIGPLVLQKLLKFGMYAVVFLAFRWYKNTTINDETNHTGTTSSEEEEKTDAAIWNSTLTSDSSNNNATTNNSKMTPETTFNVRTFVSGPGITVHVVQDFLPLDLATKWRDSLSHEWWKHRHSSSAWRYTTNNDAVSSSKKNANLKTRSLEFIPQRNASVQQAYKLGRFSYSKWELDPSLHPLVAEMEATFVGEDMIHRIRNVLLQQQAQAQEQENIALLFQPHHHLSDLFVTHFSTGDFLSSHNDGLSGTWAFVVSLMETTNDNNRTTSHHFQQQEQQEWREDFGGQLVFECPINTTDTNNQNVKRRQWCESLLPSFNTAVLFRTRPVGPRHEVRHVSYRAAEEGFHRFGVTGWYMDKSDQMNDADRAERDKMRARKD